MISNQILQNTIEEITSISRVDLGVYDSEGRLLASTAGNFDGCENAVSMFAKSPADTQEMHGIRFFKVPDDGNTEYVLLAISADGTDTQNVDMVGRMAAFQLQCMVVAYKERFDRDNYIKNLLLDNMLRIDIYNRAKKLHIAAEARRVVFLIETKQERDVCALEILHNMFANRERDFITAVDEQNIIIVRELKPNETYDDLMHTAKTILDMLNMEAMTQLHISMGSIVSEISEVSNSYKEAKMALDVGKIFYSSKNVVSYNSLGIGRIIYQLPIAGCRNFMSEIFEDGALDDLDDEMIETINRFFENNLNVSETARQLFVHRNTLVYRLDKLQKATGLDIRTFDDAITLKIALMVAKYMKFIETRS